MVRPDHRPPHVRDQERTSPGAGTQTGPRKRRYSSSMIAAKMPAVWLGFAATMLSRSMASR